VSLRKITSEPLKCGNWETNVFQFFSRIAWLIVSKDLLISRYTTAVIFFWSIGRRIKSVEEISDVSVECHFLLPLCFMEIICLDVKYGVSWFNSTLSRTLESMGSNEIGLLVWLPVKTNLYYRDAILTFKCMTGHAPECLTFQFITRGHVSRRITRNFRQLNIPLFKTVTGQKTFYHRLRCFHLEQYELKTETMRNYCMFQENSKTISLKWISTSIVIVIFIYCNF